jgi:3-phenylpropionate/cinnamic acid dioxygenase small subunit
VSEYLKQEIQRTQAAQEQATAADAAAQETALAQASESVARLEARVAALEAEKASAQAAAATDRAQEQRNAEDRAVEAATVVSLEATAELAERVRTIEGKLTAVERKVVNSSSEKGNGGKGGGDDDSDSDGDVYNDRQYGGGITVDENFVDAVKTLAHEAHQALQLERMHEPRLPVRE